MLVSRSLRLTSLLRLVTIAIFGALLWLFVRNVDWRRLADALRGAKLAPLVASSAIYFFCLFGKALTWRIMLAPNHVVGMGRLYRYTIAAFAASALAPARAGEVLRVWALKRRDGVPAHDSTAVALAEKLLDAVTLLVVCAPVPWLLPDLPEWVTDVMLMCGAIAFGVLLALFFGVGRVEAREHRSWLAHLVAGMHALRDPRRMALVVVTLLVVWTADLMAVMLVLYAVGVDVSIGGAMLILFSFNLTVAIPSTPGQVGALQVGALAATSLLGIPEEPALAFALLYQAMQLGPLLVIALVLELDLVRGRVRAEPEPAS